MMTTKPRRRLTRNKVRGHWWSRVNPELCFYYIFNIECRVIASHDNLLSFQVLNHVVWSTLTLQIQHRTPRDQNRSGGLVLTGLRRKHQNLMTVCTEKLLYIYTSSSISTFSPIYMHLKTSGKICPAFKRR